MENLTATLDRIESYFDGSGVLWISLKTSQGFFEVDRKATALRTWSALRRAVKTEYGVELVNPAYENPGRWELAVMSARFRGAQHDI